jgi:hypothetical protein
MQRSLKRILAVGVLTCASAHPLVAQPSLPPGNPPRAEKPDSFEPKRTEDSRKAEEARRDAAAAKAANSKRSSSSKSRSAEIRATMAFADDSMRATRPLIIKSGKMEAKVREQLKEDLLVMCRIIEKAAREHLSDVHKAAGIDLLALGGGNRSVRTMYLDDYGVIFALNVRIPLLNDDTPEEPEVKETSATEEWEETRNELFGQRRRLRRAHPGRGPTYDEADVQELKAELIGALKNAANIRNLKPTDWITIAVSGPGQYQAEVIEVERGRGEGSEKHVVPRVEFFSMDEAQASGDSTMILRVNKKDLDEALKKAGSPEDLLKEMEKTIDIQAY